RQVDVSAVTAVLQLPLVPSWRTLFERRLQRTEVEGWSKRPDGLSD
ncbi:molybdenum cofactor sulfurase, partial [Xanthomonas vasicola pv. musacearum NCPPB 4384]